jgi:hypothetical protein
MHLTNYSVNKKSAAFQQNQSTEEEGGVLLIPYSAPLISYSALLISFLPSHTCPMYLPGVDEEGGVDAAR